MNYEERTKILNELANELDPLIARLTTLTCYDCIKKHAPLVKGYLKGDAGNPAEAMRLLLQLDLQAQAQRERGLSDWEDVWNRTIWVGFGSIATLALMNARHRVSTGDERKTWGRKLQPKFDDLLPEILDVIGLLKKGVANPDLLHFNVNMDEELHPDMLPFVTRLTDEVRREAADRIASFKLRLSSP